MVNERRGEKMRMRKSATIMAVFMTFLLVLCAGCGRKEEFQENVDWKVISETKSEEYADEKQSETVTEELQNEGAEEIQNKIAEDEPNTINLIERDEYEPAESWTVETVENMIPIVPEGYEGVLVDYATAYTGKDGKKVQQTYTDVAFVEVDSDYIDYDKYYMMSDIIDIEGEKVSGFFMCKMEVLNFLEHKKGEEVIESFYLDIEIPEMYYMHVAAQNEKSVLIWNNGSYLFTYNFESEKCSLITDSALDFFSPVGDELYFTDWNHTEYVCNWAESNKSTETGREVVTYYYQCELSPIEDEVRQANFSAIQQAAKEGTLDKDYIKSKGYEIYNDYLYDFGIEEGFSGSIHLPYATEGGSYILEDFGTCWMVDRNQLYLYRYGERVRQYVLDEGNWCIIDSTLELPKKFWNYDESSNQISAEELNKLIVKADVLLLNTSENCLYHLSDIEGNIDLTLIAAEVYDSYASYENAGIVYYLDSNNCAYEVFWVIDEAGILIGENAVGIAKIRGEQAGFIVKPEDPRCNAKMNGVSLCTMYGHDWLNQEQTSGAWALEYDWD